MTEELIKRTYLCPHEATQ